MLRNPLTDSTRRMTRGGWYFLFAAMLLSPAPMQSAVATPPDQNADKAAKADAGGDPGRLALLQSKKGKGKTGGRSSNRRKSGRSPSKTDSKRKANPPRTSSRSAAKSRTQGSRAGGNTESVTSRINIQAIDLKKPAEQRTYLFSIVDGTYKDLVENFARMAGLGVVGEAPVGEVTFVSTEKMDFRSALNRVRLLLFKHKPIEPYWLRYRKDHLEVLRVTDVWREIPLEHIFMNQASFDASNIDENELAMLSYTPADTSVADFTLLRDFMPDYVRIAPMAETNSLSIFALVKDIKKYLSLIQLFEGAGEDPRVLVKIHVEHLNATQAVNTLRKLMDDLDESSGSKPKGRKGRGASASIDLPGQRTILFPDEAQGVIVVRAVPKKIAAIKNMLTFIDVDFGAVAPEPVLIAIKHASVDEIIDIVKPLVSGSAAAASKVKKPRGGKKKRGSSSSGSTGSVSGGPIVLLPETRRNILIVVAAEEDVQRVKRFVEMFDVPIDAKRPVFVEVKNADPDALGATITEIIKGAGAKGKKGKRSDSSFSAIFEPNTNSLILQGTDQDIAQARYLIEKLDVGEGGGKLYSYRMRNVLPSQVLNIIQLVESHSAAAPSSKGKPRRGAMKGKSGGAQANIHAQDETMMLYIVCSDAEWNENYLPLIERLEDQSQALPHHVAIPIEHVAPEDVIAIVKELFGARKHATGQLKVAATRNAILISGAKPAELDQIRAIIKDVDREGDKSERRLFKLKYADPAEMKSIIDSGAAGAKGSVRRRGKPTPGIKDLASVGIYQDTLVVHGPTDALDEIAALIAQLDVPGAENRTTRVYTVPAGYNLEDFVDLLQQLTTGKKSIRGRKGKATGAAEEIRIVSQQSARRIIVTAALEEFDKIEAHVALLLEAEPAAKSVVKFIAIQNGDASTIAAIVEPMLQRRLRELIATGEIVMEGVGMKKPKSAKQGVVSAEADVRNERIILTVPVGLLAEAEALIAELDQPQERRVFELAHADPESMKQLITSGVLGSGARAKPRGKAPPGQTGGMVVAIVDQSLVVTASPKLMEDVAELIARFDVPGAGEGVTRVYEIPTGFNVPELIKMLETLTTEAGDLKRKKGAKPGRTLRSEPRFLADSSGRRLIVNAPLDKFEEIENNLNLLLEGKPRDEIQVRFFAVKTNPAAVAEIIKPILQRLALELAGVGIGPKAGDIKRTRATNASPVEVTPDPNNERVIVSGPSGIMAKAESLIAQIDQEQDRRTFTLVYADPAEMQSIIESGVLGPSSPQRKGKGAVAGPGVVVAVIDRSLMVSGPSAQLDDIAAMIERFDVPDADTNEIRVYDIPKGLNVEEVVSDLNLLLKGEAKSPLARSKGAATGKSKAGFGEVRIVTQATSRRILISAPPARFKEIEESLTLLLDGPVPERSVTKFITLENADPTDVAESVLAILTIRMDEMVATGDVGGGRKTGTGRHSTISVIPDVNNQRVVITAPPEIVAQAEILVADFDQDNNKRDRILRTVKLVRASPAEIVETVTAMLTGKRPSPRPKRPALRKKASSPLGSSGSIAGGTERITVMEAPGGGAVVLNGLPDEVDEVEAWIHHLDRSASTEKVLKIYHIRRADVEELADIIMDLCDGGLPKIKSKSSDDFLDFEPPSKLRKGADITLTTDYWNSTILVQATPMKMFEVDQVVELYDGTEDKEPELKLQEEVPYLIYELENVDAFDATLALESVLRVVWTHGDTPDVDYIPDTNILVVKCLPEHNEEIIGLIKKYADKESEGEKSALAIVYEPIEGAAASDIAILLKMRMPGLNINLEQLGEDLPTVEQLGVYRPCVLPISMIEAIHGAAAFPLAQTADADDEDRREAARKMTSSFSHQDEPDEDDAPQGADESKEEEPGQVKLRYNDRQGVIVIEGSPREVDEVRDMLKEIMEEIESIGGMPDIRVYRIKYRNVQVAANILESMFNAAKTPQQQRTAQQQQRIQMIQQRLRKQQKQKQQPGQQPPVPEQPAQEEDEKKKRKGTGQIRIYPDAQTRSIIIRAATEDFPIIVELLATIDRPADVNAEFRVFQLDRLSAADVEQQLKVLLGVSQPRRQVARRPQVRRRGRQQGNVANQAMQQIEDALLDIGLGDAGSIDAAKDIKITSNPTANTLLVMAPKAALKLIDEFIKKLQEQEVPIIVQRTYKLQYADASLLATELKEAFSGSGRKTDGFDPNTTSKASFTAAPRTNTLIVSAYTRDFEQIESLIHELDRELDTEENVQTYVLINGDAEQVARTLNDVYGTGRQRKGEGSKAIKFVGDKTSNTLFVTAPPDLREGIAQHIKDIDVLAGELAKPRIIPLTEGKASDVAKILQAAFESRGKTRGDAVRVIGDDVSNQLIVTAPEELFIEIESLAKTMDQTATDIQPRVFRLKHARAVDVHQQLMDMVRQLGQQLRGKKMDVFTAIADDRSNTIVCIGGPVAFGLVEQVIAEIDVPKDKTASGRDHRILALEFADATELAALISENLRSTQSGGKGKGSQIVSVVANPALNSLLIGGSADEVETVVALAMELDKPAAGDSDEVEVFTLQHSDAEAILPVLESFLAKPAAGKGRRKGAASLRGDVRISANAQNNTIIVSGRRAQIDRLADVIAKLDIEVEGGNAPRIVKLAHVRPSQIEPVLLQMFVEAQPGRKKRGSSSAAVPIIVADDATNSLIIRSGAGDYTQIAQLIAMLDTEGAADEPTFTVLAVAEGVKVRDLAEMVQMTINEGELIKAERWGTQPGRLMVNADTRTNSLILAGPTVLFADAERLVRQMEKMGPTGGMSVRTVKTVNIPPEEMRRLLEQIISENQGDNRAFSKSKGRNKKANTNRGKGSKKRSPAKRKAPKKRTQKRR